MEKKKYILNTTTGTKTISTKELPKNVSFNKINSNKNSRITNINFNLLKIVLNFLSIEEILQILKIQCRKINNTFIQMNFLKIKNLIVKSITKEFRVEDIIKELYKILRKENLDDINNSLIILKKAIKNEDIFIKIEEELKNLTNSQNKDFWKYIFKLLFKEAKQIKLQSQIVKNEDIENICNILKNNNTIYSITFLEENLNIKKCADYFEKSLKTNFTLTKIPYFIYKNNSITNEFHIGINELFVDIKNLDNKIKYFLKALLSENKQYFIDKEYFMRLLFVQYDFKYDEKIQNSINEYLDENKIFTKFEKKLIYYENIFNNLDFNVSEFDLFRIIKAFNIVYNQHLFFGVYFYIDSIEIINNIGNTIENDINNQNSIYSNSLSKSGKSTIVSNKNFTNKIIYNPNSKSDESAKSKSQTINSLNKTLSSSFSNIINNNAIKKREISFNISLKNCEGNLKLTSNILIILLEITKLNFINLRYLDLKEINLTDYLFRELLSKFTAPFLTHFILNNNNISLDNLTDIDGEELKTKLSKLEVLNLDFNRINDKGFINLISKFPLSKIKELSLNVNEISAQNLGKTIQFFNFNSLRNLLFHKNKINDFGLFNILTRFNMPNLAELNLNKNEITGENIYKMPELILNRLECLFLDENNIFDDGFTSIIRKIKMPRIKRLFFNNNQITSEFINNEIFEPLNYKYLRILNLKKNLINDAGFLNILKLFKMPKILELNFNDNQISAEILGSFTEENYKNLFIFNELRNLYFEGNQINDNGFFNILSQFQIPKIKKLQFNKNNVTAENAELIPKLNFKFLEYFFLANNKIMIKNLGNILNKISMPSNSIFSIDVNIAIDREEYIDFDIDLDED